MAKSQKLAVYCRQFDTFSATLFVISVREPIHYIVMAHIFLSRTIHGEKVSNYQDLITISTKMKEWW